MSATVIIPTLDPDSDMVARCLEAIGPEVDTKVIHDTNRDGFVATCTRGADQATGDVLVFLNDDTIPQPGWLDAIEAAVTDDRIVSGLMVYPDATATSNTRGCSFVAGPGRWRRTTGRPPPRPARCPPSPAHASPSPANGGTTSAGSTPAT